MAAPAYAQSAYAPTAYAEPSFVPEGTVYGNQYGYGPEASIQSAAATLYAPYGAPSIAGTEILPPGGYGAYHSLTRDYPAHLAGAIHSVAGIPGVDLHAAHQTPFVPVPTPNAAASVRREALYAAPTNEMFSPTALPTVLPRNYYIAKPFHHRGGVDSAHVRRRYRGEDTYSAYSLHPARIDALRHQEMYWLFKPTY